MAGFHDSATATRLVTGLGDAGHGRDFAFSLANFRGIARLACDCAGIFPAAATDEQVQSAIGSRRLNLMETWPFQGLFDTTFCRNVMIHFDDLIKAKPVARFARQIASGRYAWHLKSLTGLPLCFGPAGHAADRRAA
jgi:hypothetical protein